MSRKFRVAGLPLFTVFAVSGRFSCGGVGGSGNAGVAGWRLPHQPSVTACDSHSLTVDGL